MGKISKAIEKKKKGASVSLSNGNMVNDSKHTMKD